MPQVSTLEYVAELVIRRVVAEHKVDHHIEHNVDSLLQALLYAYPFGEDPSAAFVWNAALLRTIPEVVENDSRVLKQYDVRPEPGIGAC